MSNATRNTDLAVALNRFGLGARPDEEPPDDPKAWLIGQLSSFDPKPGAFADASSSRDLAADYVSGRASLQGLDGEEKLARRRLLRRKGNAIYRSEIEMRAKAALDTPSPFVERLVHFWANHFAVSGEKLPVMLLAGAFEREAIRPHVLGRFEDMLLAAERHAAMQLFLDQVRSVGPNSRFAKRAERRNARREPGINENLAREIMELHTLGVRTGYSQQDVTEFALALTGWNVGPLGPRTRRGEPGVFEFHQPFHEPGARTVIGKTYDQKGEGQAGAVLRDLAASEATALHIATKLTRHFVADDPPETVVTALSRAYTESGGDLPTVYRALIDALDAWVSDATKFKTPWDWTISSLRGLGRKDAKRPRLAPLLNQLGQPVWRPGSPAGYDDIAASWAAPEALVLRVEAAQKLAARADDLIDARELAPKLLPEALSAMTRREVERAESAQTALALLLVSPDFQRR